MDEDQFRRAYQELNPQRCVFEKSINNRRCDCSYKRKFLLATREGVACEAAQGPALCTILLDKIRRASRFSLKSIMVDGPLPHNKELQVQAGGILQLKQLLGSTEQTEIDVYSVVQSSLDTWKDLDLIPYDQLVAGIAKYSVRTRRSEKPK